MKKEYRARPGSRLGPVGPNASAGSAKANTTGAATLSRELDGIGAARASALAEYRHQNDPVRLAENLLKMQCIGERVLKHGRDNIRLNKEGSAPAAGMDAPAAKEPAATSRCSTPVICNRRCAS